MAPRAPQQLKDDPRIRVSYDQLLRLGLRSRDLSLLPRQPARSVLNGRHGSRLRGRGLNFEELRNYLPGDDIRTIDWKVTARTGEPHVRVYTEERDRPALLLVDQRVSMFFGSQVYMKSVVAAEAAAIAAHRVLAQGDRVGGVVFGDTLVSEHRPQRRPAALHRLLASIASANQVLGPDLAADRGIELNTILRTARRLVGTNALIAVFSDFDGLTDQSESLLRALAQSNDLILFNVADPAATALSETTRLTVTDGALQAQLDASDSNLRERVAAAMRDRLELLHMWSAKYGFPIVPLTTAQPALDQVLTLFGHRRVTR